MTLIPPAPKPAAARRGIPVALFLAVVVIAAAVSVGLTAAYFESRAGPAGTTVVDDEGRAVSVPLDPHRVVVLAPSILDILYRLGVRSSVVAVGCTPTLPGGIFNEYTPNQTHLWDLSNASCVPDFPNLNTEAVALLDPQVVFASTITTALAIDQLSSVYGIPVVVLAPSTLEGIVGDVRIAAEVYPGALPTASALEQKLNSVLAGATANDTNYSDNNVSIPSVLLTYLFDSGGYYTYGPGSFGDSLVSLAGGSNIAASVALEYAELNGTVALNDQPEVIVYGTIGITYSELGQTPSEWTAAPYWSQLHGTKLAVDVSLLTEADPSMLMFLPQLMGWLHPPPPTFA